jgi:hypothetical protein
MQEIKNDDLRYIQEGNYMERTTEIISYRAMRSLFPQISQLQDIIESEIEEEDSVS